MTDHVVIRGRYLAVDLTLYGRPLAQPGAQRQQQQVSQEALMYATLVLPPWPGDRRSRQGKVCTSQARIAPWRCLQVSATPAELAPPALAGAQAPAACPNLLELPPALAGALPLRHLPPDFISALEVAAGYWQEVGRSHGKICRNPVRGRDKPVRRAAAAIAAAVAGGWPAGGSALVPGSLKQCTCAAWLAVCKRGHRTKMCAGKCRCGQIAAGQQGSAQHCCMLSHAGDADALRQLATGSRRAAVLPAELEATAVDMAVAWCNLLAHDRSATPGEVNVGLAGLAAAVVLAAGQHTALHFLCKDGAQQLLGGCHISLAQRCALVQ